MKFIYVMDDESKNALLAMGYKMLKSKENVSVFEADPGEDMRFESLDNINYVLSNVLTF